MDFDEYRGTLEAAEKLAARGDHSGAASILESLAGRDLPDLDRAAAWVAAADARERAGDPDGASASFDRAAALEAPLRRFGALFKKAEFLLRLGRKDESRDLFSSLLSRPEATLAERRSIESRLKLLRRR